MHRLQESIAAVSASEIMAQLKASDFSFTHLYDAALALSVLKFAKENPDVLITDESHISLDPVC